MNVGYRHSKVVEAIKQQAEKVLHHPLSISYSETSVNLSKALNSIIPGGSNKKIFYSSSEAEAVESGIKIAMWHTRNRRFIAFLGAYHGETLGALSLAAAKTVQVKYFQTLFAVDHISYPYCYRCPFKQVSQTATTAV